MAKKVDSFIHCVQLEQQYDTDENQESNEPYKDLYEAKEQYLKLYQHINHVQFERSRRSIDIPKTQTVLNNSSKPDSPTEEIVKNISKSEEEKEIANGKIPENGKSELSEKLEEEEEEGEVRDSELECQERRIVLGYLKWRIGRILLITEEVGDSMQAFNSALTLFRFRKRDINRWMEEKKKFIGKDRENYIKLFSLELNLLQALLIDIAHRYLMLGSYNECEEICNKIVQFRQIYMSDENKWSYPLPDYYFHLPILVISVLTENEKHSLTDCVEKFKEIFIENPLKNRSEKKMAEKGNNSIYQLIGWERNDLIDYRSQYELDYSKLLLMLSDILAKLEKRDESQKIVCECLKRQRRSLDVNDHGTYLDWATHVLALFSYYSTVDDLTNMQSTVSYAQFAVNELKEKTKSGNFTEKFQDELFRVSCECSRTWGTYVTILLQLSKKRIEETVMEKGPFLFEPFDETRRIIFTITNEKGEEVDIGRCENESFPKKLMKNEPVYQMFLKGKECINKAKEYYKWEEYCVDYVELNIQLVTLVNSYLFFARDNDENNCKLLMSNFQLLEPLVKELNSQHYLSLKRELWFLIAEVCSMVLDGLLPQLDKSSVDDLMTISMKINEICTKGILILREFIGSHRKKTNKKCTSFYLNYDSNNGFPPEEEKSLVMAYFYLARFYWKAVAPEIEQKLMNCKTAYDIHNYIKTYLECIPTAKEQMREVYDAVVEWTKFQPKRIQQITARSQMNR
ncbi:hypothetical protein SNEBB_001686 [Seison nebaliae]|nr:hypothetical protein SNEBB_001686 [Seison nebaliae]